MKILIVSTLKRRIASDIFASRSRIIFQLAKGLAEKGHQVALLGTGDSEVPGVEIIPIIPKALIDFSYENPFYAETAFLVKLAKKIEEISSDFDIIHNNTYPEHINLLVTDRVKTPMVTTLHAQATPEYDEALSLFPNTTLIALSIAHKNLFTKSHIYSHIYNGVDTNVYKFDEKKENYMFWLGRLSKAKDSQGKFIDPKGVKWAIQLAKETGEKLLLSGNVEDMEFYDKEVKPYLDDKIQWVGPVSSEQSLTKEQVVQLMQKAKVYLMTVNWNEPFGLVMAEAMSCGTPVIGFNRGSVGELIENGKTGFVVDPQSGIDGLKVVLKNLSSIDICACRKHVEQKFAVEIMVDNYEKLYTKIIEEKKL